MPFIFFVVLLASMVVGLLHYTSPSASPEFVYRIGPNALADRLLVLHQATKRWAIENPANIAQWDTCPNPGGGVLALYEVTIADVGGDIPWYDSVNAQYWRSYIDSSGMVVTYLAQDGGPTDNRLAHGFDASVVATSMRQQSLYSAGAGITAIDGNGDKVIDVPQMGQNTPEAGGSAHSTRGVLADPVYWPIANDAQIEVNSPAVVSDLRMNINMVRGAGNDTCSF